MHHQRKVDKSRKIQNYGKFRGFEKVTFPIKDIKQMEGLLNHVIINDWSKHAMQLINAIQLYQSVMNNLDIKHVSINMPKLSESKKNMEYFELFSIIDDGICYNHNRHSFKIIFGLNIHIQIKDKSAIYIHFIEYFKQRILKKIPNHEINDTIFKLISMLNY